MGTVFAMFIASFITTFCLCACFLQRDKELCHEIEKQRRLAEHEAAEKHRAIAEIATLKRHLSGSTTAPVVGERAQGYWHTTGDNPNVMLTPVPGTGPGEIERR